MKKVLGLIFAGLFLCLSVVGVATADMDKIFSVTVANGSIHLDSSSDEVGTTDGGVPAFQNRHMTEFDAISMKNAALNYGEQDGVFVTEASGDATGTLIGNFDFEERTGRSVYTANRGAQTAVGGSVQNARSVTGLTTTSFDGVNPEGINYAIEIAEATNARVSVGSIEKRCSSTENDDGTFSFEFKESKDTLKADGDINNLNVQFRDDDLNPAAEVEDEIGIEGLCPGDWGQDPAVQNFMSNFFFGHNETVPQ